MSRKKVTLRIGEGEAELLKGKFNTDNQSEAIRLEIMKSLATEDSEKVKHYFRISVRGHRELVITCLGM